MSAKPISDINPTLKIQYDITNHNLSITNETNTNSFSFLSTKTTYPPMLDNIINSPNLIVNDIKIFSYKRICFAGTFDHFHNGHNILLQLSLMLSQNEIFIGVTSDEMIKHKGKECVLQNVEYRSEMISNIIDLNGKSNSAEISIITIYDPISLAGIDQDLEVLVVTNETFKGGELVNNTRKKNQIKEVELIAINVIDYCGNIENNNPQTKISSSIIRKELIEKINLDILEFLYNKCLTKI
jgi:phosphopantetheine adenylyltransferase